MAPKLVSTYRLIESLGRGSTGEVFKAEDTRLQRLVALRIRVEPTNCHHAAVKPDN